jgi:hypothetical protein
LHPPLPLLCLLLQWRQFSHFLPSLHSLWVVSVLCSLRQSPLLLLQILEKERNIKVSLLWSSKSWPFDATILSAVSWAFCFLLHKKS